ncbi:MAG TPA: lipase maturation factor family protein [Tepidisphaeraceae bacterium]|nr:lipase maturation factor family protein [Tepidisphaeraceae bacterium]
MSDQATSPPEAGHKHPLVRFLHWLLRDSVDPRHSYVLSRRIFLAGLGAVYLIAFISLWSQIDGLVGSRGILPAAEYLREIKQQQPDLSSLERFFELPTLCWFGAGDPFLHFLCGSGVVLACLVIVGIAPGPALVLLWLLYLSLVNVGQYFLGYQWDALLLESGFLAILFAPWRPWYGPLIARWRRVSVARPSRIILLLLRWLLLRFMLLSGLVKLLSQTPEWRSLTAMRYHYWTQPLPTWTSWYANLEPNWFAAASVVITLLIEVAAPLLVFLGRRGRLFACAAFVFLQVMILLTGNFGFFNLLTIVLCVPLVDDAAWLWLSLHRLKMPPVALQPTRLNWFAIAASACLILLTLAPSLRQIGLRDFIPGPLDAAWRSVAPFESINGYGLFADMTTRRWELIIEGSDDRQTWKAYEFKWKPGDVTRRPRFCTPHMPRLDWQMWFAALDLYYNRQLDPWVLSFLDRLREGSPPVLRLLRTNPFPDHPPKYLRLVIYDYHFTTWSERSKTGAWWRRDYVATLFSRPRYSGGGLGRGLQ